MGLPSKPPSPPQPLKALRNVKIHCTVTAILPDGTRDTMTCEAASVNRAVFEYLCSRLGNGHADATQPDTVFEVQAGGRIYRTTKQRAWDWANSVSKSQAG